MMMLTPRTVLLSQAEDGASAAVPAEAREEANDAKPDEEDGINECDEVLREARALAVQSRPAFIDRLRAFATGKSRISGDATRVIYQSD